MPDGMENQVNEMSKLELLNSVLVKELKESKMEIEKLKQENEILKESSKDEINKLKQENDTLIAELAKANDEKEKLVLEMENVKLKSSSPKNNISNKKNNKKSNSPSSATNTMDIMQYILNPSDKSDPLNNSGNSAAGNNSRYDLSEIVPGNNSKEEENIIKTEMDVGPMNDFIKKFWKNPNSEPFSKETLESEDDDEIILLDEYQNNSINMKQEISGNSGNDSRYDMEISGNNSRYYDLETPGNNSGKNNSQLVRKIDCKYCDEVFSNVDDFVNHSTTYHNMGMETTAGNNSRYYDTEEIPAGNSGNNKRKALYEIEQQQNEIEYDPNNDSIIDQNNQIISNVSKRPKFNKLEMAIAPFKNIIMEITCKELKALFHTDKFEKGNCIFF